MQTELLAVPKAKTTLKTNEIVIENLNKSFDKNHVLKNFSGHLKKGENLAILGKSGSGKSVLIKCIVGLINPESGSIVVKNKDITKLKGNELNTMRQKIGFLFQSNALYDSMSVRENLEFPLRKQMLVKSNKEINNLVLKVLNQVGLEDTIDLMPSELSGGMKKRIALARTLILEPEIILYDEPTTGLDPITGKEISNLILKVQQEYKASSIIISHDMKCIEITSNRILVLINGASYFEGSYEDLKTSSDKKVNLFFE